MNVTVSPVHGRCGMTSGFTSAMYRHVPTGTTLVWLCNLDYADVGGSTNAVARLGELSRSGKGDRLIHGANPGATREYVCAFTITNMGQWTDVHPSLTSR